MNKGLRDADPYCFICCQPFPQRSTFINQPCEFDPQMPIALLSHPRP